MVLAEPGGDGQLPRAPHELDVIWHDLECGAYRADLPLWDELATSAGGPVFEIGAGTGRVALELARAGHEVTALEIAPTLLEALRERAHGLPLTAVLGDGRNFELERRDYALCLVPMQTVQLFGGRSGRLAFLRCVHSHLRQGGLLACSIVTRFEHFDTTAEGIAAPRELARIEGAIYASKAVRIAVGEESVSIEREREVLSVTEGDVHRRKLHERDLIELDRLSVETLEQEGSESGLSAVAVREIAATDDHVGSEVVILGV